MRTGHFSSTLPDNKQVIYTNNIIHENVQYCYHWSNDTQQM